MNTSMKLIVRDQSIKLIILKEFVVEFNNEMQTKNQIKEMECIPN